MNADQLQLFYNEIMRELGWPSDGQPSNDDPLVLACIKIRHLKLQERNLKQFRSDIQNAVHPGNFIDPPARLIEMARHHRVQCEIYDEHEG